MFTWSIYIECCGPLVKNLHMAWCVLVHVIECIIFVPYVHSLWYCNMLAVHSRSRGSERIGGTYMYIAFLQRHTWNRGTIKTERVVFLVKFLTSVYRRCPVWISAETPLTDNFVVTQTVVWTLCFNMWPILLPVTTTELLPWNTNLNAPTFSLAYSVLDLCLIIPGYDVRSVRQY